MSMTIYVDDRTIMTGGIELETEELEESIAPYIIGNHNQTIISQEVELNAEEIERVIVPYILGNRSETIISDEAEEANSI